MSDPGAYAKVVKESLQIGGDRSSIRAEPMGGKEAKTKADDEAEDPRTPGCKKKRHRVIEREGKADGPGRCGAAGNRADEDVRGLNGRADKCREPIVLHGESGERDQRKRNQQSKRNAGGGVADP